MNKPHFNIVFATPGNSFTPGYLRSLLRTIQLLEKENITWTFLNQGGSLVSMVRESTLAGPMVDSHDVTKPFNGEFTYDKIIWIDSDIEWLPHDFFKLFNSDKDIVSGCYLMENRNIPVYKQFKGPMISEQELVSHKEPFKVYGAGFGFICIKQGVFEKIKRPWFGPVIFEGDEVPILIGEDLSWSTKARSAGFDIWVDPSVRVIHQKTFQLFWIDQIEQMQKGMNIK